MRSDRINNNASSINNKAVTTPIPQSTSRRKVYEQYEQHRRQQSDRQQQGNKADKAQQHGTTIKQKKGNGERMK
jgi:hypothetical protein